MIDLFLTLKEFGEYILALIGTFSIVLAAMTYVTSRKQFHQGVMISCIERFQKIIPKLNDPNTEAKRDALRQYIDLCNEELFYFKGEYVPQEVAIEWLDGMIHFLPLYNRDTMKLISEHHIKEIVEEKMLDGYPRIQKAFRVSKLPDMKEPIQRKECIQEILATLRTLEYPCA